MRHTIATLLISSRHQQLRYRSAIVLYLLILILGSLPRARAEIANFASGLVLHSIAYAGLTFLLFSGTPGTPSRRAIQSLATIALMGALDEVVQSFFPYRHGTVADWLVDCSAGTLAAALLWAYWPKAERAFHS
ncbi:VanZ family protein [Janthinobacterium fluminis]|uniref:VanZ family protein n=1 Tax=Janthinobacterium fluminis TaxID=2987524 RepID=A0ABT5JYU0_9BURK|nr:VanZ family protein [Janthinobacterium fluminis]MDC8757360.1 VanZ family protein [Janthinobacterium fluminis]